MRTIIVAAALLFVNSAAAGPLIKSNKPVPNRYIAVMKESPRTDFEVLATKIAIQSGGRVSHFFEGTPPTFEITGSPSVALRIADDPTVAFVQEVSELQITSEVSASRIQFIDPTVANWHLDRLDERHIHDGLDGQYLWCEATQNPIAVRAYIIDTGIRANHSFFQPGQVVAGNDWSQSSGTATDPCPTLRYSHANGGHGTMVASVLAAWSASEVCVNAQTPGVAKGLPIVSLRTHNCFGGSDTTKVLSALRWIQQNGVAPAVVNMSFFGITNDPVVLDTLRDLRARRFALFAAANNFPSETACNRYPAAWTQSTGGPVITVGGTMVGSNGLGLTAPTDYRDFRWNEGTEQDQGSCTYPCIDIWAPARAIKVALYQETHTHGFSRGTSFSAPMAAGVAARYFMKNPAASVDQMWSWMYSAATTHDVNGNRLIQDTFVPLPPPGAPDNDAPRLLHFIDSCRLRPVGGC